MIPTPDVFKFDIQGVKWILCACDGLYDVMDNEQIAAVVQTALGMNYGTGERIEILKNSTKHYFKGETNKGDVLIQKIRSTYIDESRVAKLTGKLTQVEKICNILSRIAYLLGSMDNISIVMCKIE